MEARQPSLPEGIRGMHVTDKEWRVEHITGRLSRNDAVVDAVPFVYGVPVVAGSASRVGLDRAAATCVRICEPLLPTIDLEGFGKMRLRGISSLVGGRNNVGGS
jgi:hypothetical protein